MDLILLLCGQVNKSTLTEDGTLPAEPFLTRPLVSFRQAGALFAG